MAGSVLCAKSPCPSRVGIRALGIASAARVVASVTAGTPSELVSMSVGAVMRSNWPGL